MGSYTVAKKTLTELEALVDSNEEKEEAEQE